MNRTLLNMYKYLGFKESLVAARYRLKGAWLRKRGHRYVQRKVFDFEMFLDLEDPGISWALWQHGKREMHHREILKHFLKPGMTVLDIGANIGYYPLMEVCFMQRSGRVIAVEPFPGNIELLKRNLLLNNITNVEVISGAISDTCSVRDFHLSAWSNLSGFHPNGSNSKTRYFSGQTIPVSTFTVGKVMAEYGQPDLIRMDVEGHEVEIINGMLDDLRAGKMAPLIIFETHRSTYSDEHDMAAALNALFELGYKVRCVGSSRRGKELINGMGYRPSESMVTDPRRRAVYEHISPKDAISLICYTGGVRTVLLKKEA